MVAISEAALLWLVLGEGHGYVTLNALMKPTEHSVTFVEGILGVEYGTSI